MAPMNQTFIDRTGATLRLRTATEDDAEALIAYTRQVDTESPFLSREPGEFVATVAAERLFISRVASRDNGLFLLVLDGDTIVGALDFHGGPGARTCHAGEFGMSVARSHWGRGIGGKLLDALLDWARTTLYVQRIKLRVNARNTRAIALYRSRGFVEEGRFRRELFVDGEWVDVICMARWLDADGG